MGNTTHEGMTLIACNIKSFTGYHVFLPWPQGRRYNSVDSGDSERASVKEKDVKILFTLSYSCIAVVNFKAQNKA